MSGKFFQPWLMAASAALLGVTLNTTVSAQYNYHQQPVFSPPVIMPYVPFDDETNVVQVPQPTYIQPVQHYQATQQHTQYRPQQNHYQAPARTWRPAPTMPNPARLSNARQRVLQAARRQLGVRYRWGGNTPRQGFDCSGFTKHAMRGSNIKIPRTAAQQSRASRTISRSQLLPGDMIFFKTSGRHINHVGIYLGNGRFIHAASGGGKVTTDDLRKPYWQKRLHKYGTFFS